MATGILRGHFILGVYLKSLANGLSKRVTYRSLVDCQNIYTLVFILDSGGYTSASKAFIFSLYNVKGYSPVKLTQYQNQQYAMYWEPNYGPSFGYGPDIYISDNATAKQNSSTQCGGTYSFPSGYSTADCQFFTGASHFTPTDIEVFYEIGNKFMFLCWVDVIFATVIGFRYRSLT